MNGEMLPNRIDGDMQLRFRLPVYEGPLDLLLHLIKRAELDPQYVTTSVITEQYLEFLNLMQELNLDVAGEYLVMAATLLLIKSFSLLPHPQGADTEEAEDLKRDLVERLLEYQRYREAAAKLGERPLLGRDVFACLAGHGEFEIMDGRGAVQGHCLENSLLNPVNQIGSAARLDDMPAQGRRRRPPLALGPAQVSADPAQLDGRQLLGQAA